MKHLSLFILLFLLSSLAAFADTEVFNMNPELADEVQLAVSDRFPVQKQEEEKIFDKELTYDEARELYDEENLSQEETESAYY